MYAISLDLLPSLSMIMTPSDCCCPHVTDTNAATPYYGVYLFFPSVFMHMEFATGTGNDGILEGRLAVSRDGHTAKYVDAPNARGPFLPLGVNRCDELQPAKYPAGVEWCANDATMGKSDFDASEIYTAAGYALGSDGESVIVYYGGMVRMSIASSCDSLRCKIVLRQRVALLQYILLDTN